LSGLIADLAGAGAAANREVAATVKRGAVNIRKAWRQDAAQANPIHAKGYAYTIGFDMYQAQVSGEVRAVIGPDKDRGQGALGNLLEFGGPENAPQLSGQQALDAEAPRLVEWLGKVTPW
jgi:hypothetical protein